MTKQFAKWSFFLALNVINSCMATASPVKDNFIGYNNPRLAISGRVSVSDSAAVIYWSGTTISMNFEGTEVKAKMRDENGLNYFNIIVDDKQITRFHPGTELKLYTLVSKLTSGKHNIQVFKLTEESHGRTWFYGFDLNPGGKLLDKPTQKKRKIEFYGDSKTSGYSLEDTATDSKKPEYFNNYLTYAAITARHFDAEYYCISKSGIGITVSWFPIIMPELYDRLDPKNPNSKWDFTKYTPDVVVVSLLNNDVDLLNMPNDENFIARFGTKRPSNEYIITAYKNFIQSLRNKYPGACIICTLDAWKDPESDGHKYPGFIKEAVNELNDKKILTYFFDYQKQKKKGHPKAKDNEAMAAGLIDFMETNVKW